MAWSHFTAPENGWVVVSSSHPDLKVRHTLKFEGGGGKTGNKMTTSAGDSGSVEYIGGDDPEILNLSFKGSRYHIKRSGSAIVCHRGTASLKRRPGPLGQDGDDGGEGTQPIWEAQEGG